ncbi:MAG: dephospho-CoA kinase [Desulfobacteraceae bacterium]|nr:MAG: dephospho-CoA kinase [Desulfobacteraceae bacterium]
MIAGLTGGIASGKSTVADIFREAGAFIVDADRIAREVVRPGMPAWQEIRDVFGEHILSQDGEIDRPLLGRIVFNDPKLRRRLESIVHPRIGAEMDARIGKIAQVAPAAVVIMDIPLLLESGKTHGLSEIIVVYAPEAVQLERLVARDGLSPQEAQARMAAQMPMAEKVKRAGMVIDNSGTLTETRRQTLAAYEALAARADR